MNESYFPPTKMLADQVRTDFCFLGSDCLAADLRDSFYLQMLNYHNSMESFVPSNTGRKKGESQTCSPYARTAQSGAVVCSDDFCQSWSSSTRAAQKSDTQAYAHCASGALPAAVPPVQTTPLQPPSIKVRATLRAATYNSNSWRGAKVFLRQTTANLVFIQEHKLISSKIPEARTWARLAGWSSYWAPALETAQGGFSAGVAIFVRHYFQSWVPDDLASVVVPHRCVAVVVHACGLSPMLAMAAYFYTNTQARECVTPPNLTILATIGQCVQALGYPVIIGADWNAEPLPLVNSGFPGALGLVVKSSCSSLGTCVQSTSTPTLLDYFLVSEILVDVTYMPYICPYTAPRPHRPSYMDFHYRPRSVKVAVVKEAPRLPAQPPFGPLVPPTCWEKDHLTIKQALEPIVNQGPTETYPDRDDAEIKQHSAVLEDQLDIWTRHAEDDLLYILGAKNQQTRGRGLPPQTIKVDVFRTFRSSQPGNAPLSRALRWVQSRFLEFAKSLNAWHDAVVVSQQLKARRCVEALIFATIRKGIIRTPLNNFKFDSMRKQWHPKFKSLLVQLIKFMAHTKLGRPEPAMLSTLVARCQLYASHAAQQAIKQDKLESNHTQKAWREWVAEATRDSASRAHKYSKAQILESAGDRIGTPLSRSEQLTNEVKNWSELWKEDNYGPTPVFSDVQRLPRGNASDLRKAAQSFKKAACSVSGFHPRHPSLLPDAALEGLALIFDTCEALGVPPPQLCYTFVALIPKASMAASGGPNEESEIGHGHHPFQGGWGPQSHLAFHPLPKPGRAPQKASLRPVAWYPSLYRVWSKMRLYYIKEWQSKYIEIHSSFGSGKNKSAIDIVWKHAWKAEAAQSAQQTFACLLSDVYKCYECVDHQKLVQAGRQHNYPLVLLRLAIASYRAPRRILYSGLVSRPIAPSAGILAGNTSATTELKLMFLDVVIKHQHNHKGVTLSIYEDDLSLDCFSNDRHQVISSLTEAAIDLQHSVESLAGLTLAPSKSAVLSNVASVAATVRRTLGPLGGPAASMVRSLGADFWAARPNVGRFMPVRMSRCHKLAARRYRLHALRHANKQGAAKVFVVGILPSVLWDAPIYGLFGNPLLKLRRETAQFLGISRKRRSLDFAFSFRPQADPELLASLPLVLRHASAAWSAALPAVARDPCGLTLGTLAAGMAAYLRTNPNPPPRSMDLSPPSIKRCAELTGRFLVLSHGRQQEVISLSQPQPALKSS